MSEIDYGKVVYTNTRYEVFVGAPESTTERPNPRAEYLIVNKETGVQEYSHTVLFIAKDWADNFAKLMDGGTPTPNDGSNQVEMFN